MTPITISTSFDSIVLSLSGSNADDQRSGTIIHSELSFSGDDALDAIESLLLAHACCGVDVTSPAYISGLNTALEAITNHL